MGMRTIGQTVVYCNAFYKVDDIVKLRYEVTPKAQFIGAKISKSSNFQNSWFYFRIYDDCEIFKVENQPSKPVSFGNL